MLLGRNETGHRGQKMAFAEMVSLDVTAPKGTSHRTIMHSKILSLDTLWIYI